MPLLSHNLSPHPTAAHPKWLSQLAGKRAIEEVTFLELEKALANKSRSTGIILTGNYHAMPAVSTADALAPVMELLRSTELPVLGVGLGFEVLCAAYGATMAELGEYGTGAVRIEPTDEGAKLFQGSDPLRVVGGERWLVEELPKVLVVLARSETGIEAIKHKTKIVYGLQQRPEDFAYPSDAKMVYENILSQFDAQTAKSGRKS